MAVFETWLKSDLKKPMRVVELSGNLFSADNGGNLIGVEVLDGGQAASLTGSVHGYVIRADGATVLVDGTLTGNRASIVLPASAYLVIGQASIVIKVGAVTVGACVAQVYRTTTDTLVDPANVIPSISELLEAIDDCEQATADANSAAELANTKAGLADDAATLANTKAGLADAAATAANTAAGTANAAAGKIDNMTVAANGLAPGSAPTVAISEVSGHKHILFGLVKGDPGKDFHIAKTFSSIAQMMAYTGTDIEAYDFAMIDTGSVQDPDTGKLYCYEPDTQDRWQYIGDLSGAQGIKGETGTGIDHITLNADYTLTIYLDDNTSYTTASIRGATGETPDITIGTVTTLNYDQQAYVRLAQSSTPEDPVLEFGIPQGEPGSAENVYGNTVPMSSTDSTKVATAINAKLDANQGSANAGKFMRVGSTGAVSYDSPTERYSSLNDFPATGDEGKLYIAEDTGMMYVWDSEYVPVGGTSSDECEVSGDVVSFETFESKAKELVVNIAPMQDLHGYDSPWPAGGGVNLLDPNIKLTAGTYFGVTVTTTDGYNYKITGTANETGNIITNQIALEDAVILPPGTYIGSGSGLFGLYDVNGLWLVNKYAGTAFTMEQPFFVKNMYWVITNGSTYNISTFISLTKGSTALAEWSPYSNLCPISGWDSANVSRTGKNLIDITAVTDDKTIGNNGSVTDYTGSRLTDYIYVRPNTKYILSGTNLNVYNSGDMSVRVNYYTSAKVWTYRSASSGTSGISFTTDENTYYVRLSFSKTGTNPQLEIGETASEYEQFKGQNKYNITFPASAGTVYGGTLTIHQDGSGELVVTPFTLTVNGTQTLNSPSSGAYDKENTTDRYIVVTGMKSYSSSDNKPVWSSAMKFVAAGIWSADVPDSYNTFNITSNQLHINFQNSVIGITSSDDRATRTAKISAWLENNPITFVLPLATPVTYQLTNQQVLSLLKGVNNVWADTGSIDLTYYGTETAYQVSLNTADIAELKGEVEANSDAIEELQQDFTGATASTDGAHGLVPAPEEGDQGKFLKGDGSWGEVPNPQVMTGATSSTAGVSGLVPAPAAGDQEKVLTGAGTWETPIGSRVYVVTLDTVTNTRGSYTHTTTVTGMTGDLKAVAIECSDPTIFKDAVTITTATDSVTLACSEVAGSSTVKVSFLAVGNANPLSSTEYAALDARIGDLSDLTTTDKSSVVDAVNEVNGKINKISATITTSSAGNAILNDLTGNEVIIGVVTPNNNACDFVGKGADGIFYCHIVDGTGTARGNVTITLDIYYINSF